MRFEGFSADTEVAGNLVVATCASAFFPAHRLVHLLMSSAASFDPSEAQDGGGLGVRLTRHEAGSSSSGTCSTSDNV